MYMLVTKGQQSWRLHPIHSSLQPKLVGRIRNTIWYGKKLAQQNQEKTGLIYGPPKLNYFILKLNKQIDELMISANPVFLKQLIYVTVNWLFGKEFQIFMILIKNMIGFVQWKSLTNDLEAIVTNDTFMAVYTNIVKTTENIEMVLFSHLVTYVWIT